MERDLWQKGIMFPVYTGMNRMEIFEMFTVGDVPRIYGDEPPPALSSTSVLGCSPYIRG